MSRWLYIFITRGNRVTTLFYTCISAFYYISLILIHLLIFKFENISLGPLLKEMIDHMVKKAQRTLQPDRKLWVYSAHDSTIASMLMTLNLFEHHCPPYAAMILMELRTNLQNQYFVTVRILLNIHRKYFCSICNWHPFLDFL